MKNIWKSLNRRRFVKYFSTTGLLLLNACSSSSKKRGPSSLWQAIFHDKSESNLSQVGIKRLKDEYDMVIVGSGYGASVVAANLSKENPNASICILERGREYRPGDFPKSAIDVAGEVRTSVNELGLLDKTLGYAKNSDLDIISASGLGGTSLLNALLPCGRQEEYLNNLNGHRKSNH